MINYDDGEANLLSFYSIPTLRPTSLEELNIKADYVIDDEDKLESLSVDSQFDLLNQLVQNGSDTFNEDYQFYDNDIADPLRGSNTNVVRELLDKQVISSKNDPELNKYLISSREFNSTKFLTTIHKDTPMDQLNSYLRFLESSISQQAGQLKDVVDNNYLKFIDVKDSIDEILGNFKNSKTRSQQEMEKIRIFNPSRSKQYEKDNKFLISGLEDSIKNLTTATTILIRPIMDNETKETKISQIIEFIRSHKTLFDLPSNLIKHVKNRDHELIVEALTNYSREKETLMAEQNFKLNNVHRLSQDKSKIQEIISNHQGINTLVYRVFDQVDSIIEEYKNAIYKELLTFDQDLGKNQRVNNTRFFTIVDKINELESSNGVPNVSPINKFLKNHLTRASEDVFYQFTKFEDKFSVMQTKILNYIESSEYRTNGSYVKYIREKFKGLESEYKSTTVRPTLEELEKKVVEYFNSNETLDLSLINETWLVFLNFITYLHEIYLKSITRFIEYYNHYSKTEQNIDSKGEITRLFIDSIVQVSDRLYKIFKNQDTNQLESSPSHYNNILPNYCNSLSTIFYITKINSKINDILSTFGLNVTVIGNIGKTTETNKIVKSLRNISNVINQKILESTCSVWVNDCSQIFDLESWEIDNIMFNKTNEESTNTKLVSIIDFYMIYMLKQVQSLVFINSPESDSFVKIISAYPSKKMLVSIEIQFMRCLSIIVDSIMKKYNLEQQLSNEPNFKILTMNNIDKILRKIYPQLLSNYDSKFDKDLSQQHLKIFTDIDKVNFTILDDILSKERVILDDILSGFFNKVSRATIDEIKIDNFIYEGLTHFVKLVYGLKPITNRDFFVKIINELQDFFLKNFLDYFRKLNSSMPNFNIVLINLKLDVNFFIEAFEKSPSLKLNDYSFNIAEIILTAIKEMESDTISDKEFDNILLQSLRDSENQFDCLGR